MLKAGSCIVSSAFEYIIFFMYNEVYVAVFRPKASVTVAELLEIDRTTTQSLWGLPDIHLREPIHTSHFLPFLLCTPLIRTLSLSASGQKT